MIPSYERVDETAGMDPSSAKLIIFGPQISYPQQTELSQLRSALLQDANLQPFVESILSLPEFWETLTKSFPVLFRTPGLHILTHLKSWLEVDHGSTPFSQEQENVGFETSNILLTPLTVILHVVQYSRYLSTGHVSLSLRTSPQQEPKQEIDRKVAALGINTASSRPRVEGFCTGLLAAAAVDASSKLEDLSLFASAALRLAVCIGAFVDMEGRYGDNHDETSCLFVSWSGDETAKRELWKALNEFPEIYISVIKDSSSVTLTIPKITIQVFTRKISTLGLISRPITLEGRFHSIRHTSTLSQLQKFCLSQTSLQFPENLSQRTLGTEIELIHEKVLKSILVDQCNWFEVNTNAAIELAKNGLGERLALVFGQFDCFPRALAQQYGITTKLCKELELSESKEGLSDVRKTAGSESRPDKTNSSSPLPNESSKDFPEDSIAIVGMACRFPGADSIEEFWDLLVSGRSMVSELPQDRFGFPGQLRRSSNTSKYWGNFLKDVKSFDHKFFKKSSREAASMDPQQRLALQVAYEALESSGYFASPLESNSVGVYLGVGSVDYQDNVTSHMPTAFSALGTLRAFISGKISHHFGWTGPSLTYDTACSSSAVAIHQACKAIQNGECTMAVTGGVNVITSPVLFQNLGAASFLSPSGASKAFDAKADGYCRGEGCGLVVLKRLSSVAPGDRILAVITGSAVNQNDNSSPITVPHSESQSSLYRQVAKLSEINPIDVAYVEAHGTGTPVGDPIEAASVRQVFGGPRRQEKLWLGSVKGNIGHLEAASGAAALIKSILMIQKAIIPKQASFTSLNPRIPALAPDNIEIATETQPWNTPFRSVLINNYGAAGSNAALIVCESPVYRFEDTAPLSKLLAPKQEMFIAAAHTLESLKKFCASIQNAISKLQKSRDTAWFSSLAYNLSQKQNPQHKYKFIATATSSSQLWSELEEARIGSHRSLIETHLSPRPVVLCFGGQSNNFVGLEKTFYDDTLLLRKYLDDCDSVCRSTAGISIYPSIFSKEPVTDIKIFHCAIFSLQYACARAWIESGLKVNTVIGHSIGQITALCVSGVLSLTDGLKFLAVRGSLIEQNWGSEKGAMIALEASLEAITELMDWFEDKGFDLEIACHNGPSSYVLVGSKKVIECVKMLASDSGSPGGVISTKTLKVTHGFHSKFVDSILPALIEVAKDFEIHEPSIAIETCSEESWAGINHEMIVSHSREPVFFEAAIKRIKTRLGSAIWVEAGSMSSITNMARKVVGKDRDDLFLPAKFNGPNAMDDLMKTTEALQHAGINAIPWSYHSSQQNQYANINLPPYQFEKTKHWLEYKDLVEASAVVTAIPEQPAFDGLVRLTRYQNGAQLISEFEINQFSQTFRASAEGHAVLGNSLCPISLYLEIVAQATRALQPMASSTDSMPAIENLEVHAPLGIDGSRSYQLVLTSFGEGSRKWTFAISSRLRNNTGNSKSHATGTIILSESAKSTTEKSRYERLIGLTRCNKILDDETAESMQGALIYRTFDRVVHYKEYYRGVKRVSAKNGEVAGIVSMPSLSSTTVFDHVCNPLAIDCFLQVAGLHVNSLRECGTRELFVCTSISRTLTYEAFLGSRNWVVYSNAETIHDKLLSNDIFVFDKDGGSLVMAILGVMFSKVITSSFERVLAAVNTQKVAKEITEDKPIAWRSQKPIPTSLDFKKHLKPIHTHLSSSPDTLYRVKRLLSNIADTPSEDIKNNTNLISLGIDSLMAAEVLSDIKSAFQVDVPTETFQSFETVSSLSEYIQMHSETIDSSNNIPISSVFSEFPKQPRDFDSISTPDSSVSPNSEADHKSETSKSDLLRVLAGHLEVPEFVPADFDLRQAGLDSLGSMELQSDIEKKFGVTVDLDGNITFEALLKLVFNPSSKDNSEVSRSTLPNTFDRPIQPKAPSPSSMSATVRSGDLSISQAFGTIRNEYEKYAEKSNQSGFYTRVHPQQSQLVIAYIVEAFTQQGFPLQSMPAGERIPTIPHLPSHEQVTNQILHILEVARLIKSSPGGFVRTDTKVDLLPSRTILEKLLAEHPQHASEHQLLSITGSQLASCLTGEVDPLQLIFGSKSAKALLEDVYTNAPMFATGTNLLTSFLHTLAASTMTRDGEPLRILEIGGGTGGTTKSVIETLIQHNIPFVYHFTDISPSLVRSAKTKFKKHESSMDFSVLDIEKEPPAELLESFHIVISTNCIHATKGLVTSTTNIRKMLRKDGVLCLIELTRNLYWFDLVFGLLGGWWRFEDGRKHALADEKLWERTLLTAGFEFVDWTKGDSRESEQLRLIVAGKTKEDKQTSDVKAKTFMETVTYKKEGNISLLADIYYPSTPDPSNFKRPVALMIHGGGHVMLSRTSIRPAQTRLLLANNFLPISIDYRLCPEISLQSGPMVDVLSALQWIHSTLPDISLKNKTIKADPSRTIAIGWSSGGHLAMSLGWTAPQIGLAPPNAILAFYCATDYDDPFWKKPNIPLGTEEVSGAGYDVREGVMDHSISGYNVPASVKSKYGWLSLKDPRSRIALHMNWKGQTLPILMGRLNKSDEQEDTDTRKSGGTSQCPIYEQPSQHEIAAISPLSQIKNGKYHSPTYIIHGRNDDLIPWNQSQRTFEALQQRNIPAGMEIVDDAPHLLDLRGEADEEMWEVVKRGYEWVFNYV